MSVKCKKSLCSKLNKQLIVAICEKADTIQLLQCQKLYRIFQSPGYDISGKNIPVLSTFCYIVRRNTATVLCRSVGSGPDVRETSMGSVSGDNISSCLSNV